MIFDLVVVVVVAVVVCTIWTSNSDMYIIIIIIFSKCYSVKFFRERQYVYGKFKYYQKQARYVYCVYVFQRKRQDIDSHFYSNLHIYKSIFRLIKNAISVLLSTKFTNNNNNNNNNTLLLCWVVLCVQLLLQCSTFKLTDMQIRSEKKFSVKLKFKYYQKQAWYVYCVYVFERKSQDFDSHFYSNSHIYKFIFLLIKNVITVLLSTKFTNNNNNNNNTLLLLSYVMCPTSTM